MKLDSFWSIRIESLVRQFHPCAAAECCVRTWGEGELTSCDFCGDNVGRMRWHEQWMERSTTIERFYDFIDHIIDDLDQNHPGRGRSFMFTMNNLSAHKNPLVTNRILMAGHRYVFCAPYWPVDGAVEYVFNEFNRS
jgi:hypothetical protein